MISPLAIAQVIQQVPKEHAVLVRLQTGEQPVFPIEVGYHGYADPFRINQHPLPQVGTWGLVAFVNGDIRNGVWICSYYAQQADAIASDTDPTLEYESHWSGFWRSLNQAGTFAAQWPDGTSLVIGSGIALPAPTRHIVNQNSQVQQTIPFTMADRVPSPPSAFQLQLTMKSGTTLTLDAAGDWTLVVPKTISETCTTLNISAAGAVTITAGSTMSLSATTSMTLTSPLITLAASTEVHLQTPLVVVDGDIVSSGLALLRTHTHTGVVPGTGVSGPPVSGS